MKWIYVIIVTCVIEDISMAFKSFSQYTSNNKKYAPSRPSQTLPLSTSAPSSINTYKNIRRQRQQQQRYHYKHPEPEIINGNELEKSLPELEIDTLKCPLGCVCQYAHFMDLPISRWINFMKQRQSEKPETRDELINDNEAMYEGDESFLTNPFMKQATCLLQVDSDVSGLVQSLPLDLQALILLYTGVGENKTVNLSVLKPLNQLTTLEIRGVQNCTFRLIFDEPLSFLQYANFESIVLLGSEDFKRPKNPIHPSDSFDYRPRSELFEELSAIDDDVDSDGKLAFAPQEEQDEILPYDLYMQEVKKARMPSFYGWEHLEVLRIYDCQLSELQWEMFDGLAALQHLSLERNNIREVPAFSFYGVMHIKTLSLAHNHIHDLHYRALAGLLDLEMLDLSDNRLGKLSERSFPPFPKLERVDFRHNPIKHILPASFWVMNSTRVMLFDSHDLALQLWANLPFESLVELRELTVGNVTIGNLEQNIFKGLSSLEKLQLTGLIRRIEFDAFASLNELRELQLAHCGIQEISMDAFMDCRKLEIIDLSHNNLSYIPPGLFDDQTALLEIYLQGNQLQTLPYTFFLQPKLRLARLDENPWNCNCDMNNWRSKITNQVRGPRTERCITDFQSGKKIACRRVETYTFDHRFAPRCKNYNERSVFYVLRKQLHCGGGRIVRTKHRPNKTRYTNSNKIKYNKNAKDGQMGERVPTWQVRREQKSRYTNAQQQNSLDYVLRQGRKKSKINKNTSKEISNDI